MTTKIKDWLEKDIEIEKAGLQISVILNAIEETVKYIKERNLFNKKHNATEAISIVVDNVGVLEIHISIDGFSTYKSFKEPKETKQFLVPFAAEEIVWNDCIARVEATSKEEAFAMVEQSIEESNPFRDFNADWDGVNTVTSEVIQTTKYCIGDDYNLSVEDIKEVNELEVELTFSAFDLLRLEKDAVYQAVEQQLDGVKVLDMEMIPTKISGSEVTYRCVPTDFIAE